MVTWRWGGGGYVFFGKNIFCLEIWLNKNFCLWNGQKKKSVSTLCLKKYCFCRKKSYVTTTCREKIYFASEKQPYPFKLNGCSISIKTTLLGRVELVIWVNKWIYKEIRRVHDHSVWSLLFLDTYPHTCVFSTNDFHSFTQQ